MSRARYNFHGDPARFPVLADFVTENFPPGMRYIADVAGGQGMLARLLRKRNFDAEVVDPRGWRLHGVAGREEEFRPELAGFYDLVIGLHPDEATQAVALSALVTRTILVPCCNFWDRSQRLGRLELLESIECFYREHGVDFERLELGIRGPKNLMLVTVPPRDRPDLGSVKLPPATRPETLVRGKVWLEDVRRKTRH